MPSIAGSRRPAVAVVILVIRSAVRSAHCGRPLEIDHAARKVLSSRGSASHSSVVAACLRVGAAPVARSPLIPYWRLANPWPSDLGDGRRFCRLRGDKIATRISRWRPA